MWEIIKAYKNAILSVLASTIVAWLLDFSKASMDKTTSFISMLIMFYALFTVIDMKRKGHKKHKTLSEKIATSQKQIKVMERALYPEESIEEVLEIFDKQGKEKSDMDKFKNFLKALWGNKYTLANTILVLFIASLSQVMVYTDKLYNIEWFAQNEIVVKIASPIIAAIWVIVDLYTTYTKYGFENLEELENKKLSKLSKEEKDAIKNSITSLESALKTAETKYSEFTKIIKDTELLISAGYTISTQENAVYTNARNTIANIETTIANLNSKIEELKSKL